MKRRYGVLTFSHEFLHNPEGSGLKLVEDVLCWLRFVPFKVESLFAEDNICMQGYLYARIFVSFS